ncbi:unnamed protein product [Staurois parvus]|uniref:Uncharacterized protein n=1 Tax=Staurois parvus TaxID=386267 RepID=A0ABN9EZG7_9NEOB|nr:unnamed protein product [Staurois parvus]
MWGDQRVNSMLFVFYYVDKLLCIALLCSLFVLTGDWSVLFTYKPLPCQLHQQSLSSG